jgi:predicted NBD/HSP70 family sugar kinase
MSGKIKYVSGMDVGGTNIKPGIVTAEGKVIKKHLLKLWRREALIK